MMLMLMTMMMLLFFNAGWDWEQEKKTHARVAKSSSLVPVEAQMHARSLDKEVGRQAGDVRTNHTLTLTLLFL